MRVVVPVKYVPDIQSDRRFGDDGRVTRVLEEGSLNELDESAIETALRLVESLDPADQESSEVIAVTVGGPDADLALRKSYQFGVTRGIRVTDDALIGSDYFGTAKAIAGAVRTIDAQTPVDLVISGMAALDGLGSVVPTLLAAELSWPALLLARNLTVDSGVASIERELDGVTEFLSGALPAVISVTDHIAAPRYPNFTLIMSARTKPIEEWSLADISVSATEVGLAAARSTVESARPAPPREAVQIHVDSGEGGQALADYLISRNLV